MPLNLSAFQEAMNQEMTLARAEMSWDMNRRLWGLPWDSPEGLYFYDRFRGWPGGWNRPLVLFPRIERLGKWGVKQRRRWREARSRLHAAWMSLRHGEWWMEEYE